MPDILSAADLAAIAAFPASRVQRIAQGISGEVALTLGGWRTDGRSAAPGAVAKRRATSAVKRKRIAALVAEGQDAKAIAEAVDMPLPAVRSVVRAIKAEGATR